MTRARVWVVFAALFAVLSRNAGAGGDAAAVDAALKQVTKALGDVRGVVADAEFDEIINNRPIHGSGKLYVDLRGYVRAEMTGDEPRTIVFRPPHLYVYRPSRKTVEVDDVTANPDRLAPYLLVGFVPAGSALKKSYVVQMGGDDTLDEKPVLNFTLTPNSKKAKELARAVGMIKLWIDPATGFPARQRVVHASGLGALEARIRNATRSDALPDTLFQPIWAEGTKVIRK